jgi:hypothetical protein
MLRALCMHIYVYVCACVRARALTIILLYGTLRLLLATITLNAETADSLAMLLHTYHTALSDNGEKFIWKHARVF